MKKFTRLAFLLLAFVLICSCLSAQQPKRVYITLDVSASMSGNKYVMANYTAQLISVFCDQQDSVCIYYLGEKHDLTGKDDYKKLHKRFEQLPARKASYIEISDLSQFMRDYKPNASYQDWLFIIGDGDWDWRGAKNHFDRTTKDFSQFVKNNQIHVCYLQTGDKTDTSYAFTSFLQSLALPEIEKRKSDTSAKSVQENTVFFANKILGFSEKGIEVTKTGKTNVEFSSAFPLEGFLLLYQDHQGHNNEIEVVTAKCANKSIVLQLKGNPTTKPLVKPGQPILNGKIWECHQEIQASKTVTLAFNQEVEVNNLRLYPSVDVQPRVRPYTINGTALTESATNAFHLCKKEDKIKVRVEVTDKNGKKFPPSLLQKITVQLNYGTGDHKARYQPSDTSFLIVIPMVHDTLSYHVTVLSKGYFNRISEKQTIMKSDECPPELIPTITLPVQHFSAVKFKDLLDGHAFGGVVNDTLFQQLFAYGFDIQQLQDSPFKDSTHFSLIGDSLCLIQHVNSSWCECAYPDTLHYTILLKSTSGIVVGDKMYQSVIVPISIPVDKRSWGLRCKQYLVSLICLLLFFVYLLALRRKKRFGKEAKITPYYYNRHGDLICLGAYFLRKKGIEPWFSRWFLPGDERRTLKISSPEANLTFMATESNNIQFPSSTYNSETMNIPGALIKKENKFIKLSDHNFIEFQKENGTLDGRLVFTAGDKNTEFGYRLFLGILLLATVAAVVATIVVLLRGLF